MTQQNQPTGLTLPVGRIVQGSVYDPQTTDMEGNPLVVKNGPNKGQPTKRWYFAVAIPKTPGATHWATEEFGKIIWARGHADFPQGQGSRPGFAWKIEDGDSAVPNKNNKKPCDQEGFKGCWVLRLSSGFPPKTYNADGTAPLEPGVIKPGYYVQVYLTVAGNEDGNRNPGVYLNPSMVALSGYGPEITFGPDPSAAGFGKAPLPAGASAVPVAAFTPPVAPAPGTPPAPAPVVPAAPVAAITPAAPVPVPVAPHATILGAGAPPPPPAAGKVMLPKAGATTYEAYRAAGWSDEQLVANGLMQP